MEISARLLWLGIVFGLATTTYAERHRPSALFVFGDSYVDTGNHRRSTRGILSSPWRPPYGITWPRTPIGRFSDGFNLADFVAGMVKIPSPVPFQWMERYRNQLPNGVNFAFGGSGVSYTFGPQFPNISTQINQMEAVMKSGIYSSAVISSSIAFLEYSGNDYGSYKERCGGAIDEDEMISLVYRVVKLITTNVERLYEMGFRRIVMNYLQPVGCSPLISFGSNYTKCNETDNELASLHNTLLQNSVTNLQQAFPLSTILILDHYTAFMNVISNSSTYGFMEPLRPCCERQGYSDGCGSVSVDGHPNYTVCPNRAKYFWWDDSHPTQTGWEAVSKFYKPALSQLLESPKRT